MRWRRSARTVGALALLAALPLAGPARGPSARPGNAPVDGATALRAALARALAEEAGVVARLRPGARWRRWALDVRRAALDAAARSRGPDRDARRALKIVHARCEVCHQGYQR